MRCAPPRIVGSPTSSERVRERETHIFKWRDGDHQKYHLKLYRKLKRRWSYVYNNTTYRQKLRHLFLVKALLLLVRLGESLLVLLVGNVRGLERLLGFRVQLRRRQVECNLKARRMEKESEIVQD